MTLLPAEKSRAMSGRLRGSTVQDISRTNSVAEASKCTCNPRSLYCSRRPGGVQFLDIVLKSFPE